MKDKHFKYTFITSSKLSEKIIHSNLVTHAIGGPGAPRGPGGYFHNIEITCIENPSHLLLLSCKT